MRTPRALAVLHFEVAPQELNPWAQRDLAVALRQIATDVPRLGRTAIVPLQDWRSAVKVKFDVFGPGATMKAMGFQLEYNGLPPEHLMEVSALARSFAEFVRNKSGTAAGSAEKFRVTFNYDAEQGFALPVELRSCFKNDAVQDELKFSEASALIDAGIKLLADLQEGAHREIAAGQRS